MDRRTAPRLSATERVRAGLAAHGLAVHRLGELLCYDRVWAAAGTPNSVFAIARDELVRISGGRVEDFTERT